MFEPKVDVESSEKDYSKKKIVDRYVGLAENVGLWKSEEYVFEKFISPQNKILDVGCGAGRTTFGLFERGFVNIEGVDASKKLIVAAKKLARKNNLPINFYVDDALALDAANESFDAVIFSYNGLMTIPGRDKRVYAVSEIARVLRPGGLFVFTTHDRDDRFQDKLFWKEEKLRFENNTYDKRLTEFGDRIIEEAEEELFVHIPTTKEVYSLLDKCGFDCIWTKMRWDICATPEIEKELFGECRFFVARKRG